MKTAAPSRLTVLLVAAALACCSVASANAAPAGWKHFADKKDGYSFDYPADWGLAKDFYDGMPGPTTPHGVGLTSPASLKDGTNFGTGTFSIERTKDKDCTPDKFDSDVTAVHPLDADGRSYLAGHATNHDGSERYESYVFVVKGLPHCTAVRYVWQVYDMFHFTPGEAKPFDEKALLKTLDAVRASVVFK